jgi:ADP-ribose pyrophosphatase YjhB (NUDIX family)
MAMESNKRMMAKFNSNLPAPAGGFCISVFVIIKQASTTLIGTITDPSLWSERWGLSIDHPERWDGKWQIPATYLLIGENPKKAAERVCREQLELENYSLSDPSIFATQSEDSANPAVNHADLFFVYKMFYNGGIKRPAHFGDLKFIDDAELPKLTFGRGHDEVLSLIGLL